MTQSEHSLPDSLRRRRLIVGAGQAGLAAALTGPVRAAPGVLRGEPGDPTGSDLFPLGVASGDPNARSVVLWTRLSPDPFAVDSGMNGRAVRIIVKVASDPAMINVLRTVESAAHPEYGYNVNIAVGGLPSDQWLYYRFYAPTLSAASRVGKTRTFPEAQASVAHMRFAMASCQSYEQGFYTAYRDMLEQDVDFVVHCGDYIYENAGSSAPLIASRVHLGQEIFSVEDYRTRYAQYRLDPDLQNMHANAPFLVTWDDHEVDNNWAGDFAEEGAPFQSEAFLARKRNALQVYRESMPMRQRARTFRGQELRIYRQLEFGQLANLLMLDTRQYRSDQPAEDGFGSTDPNAVLIEPALGEVLFDPAIAAIGPTMLGLQQERWLRSRLRSSNKRWNVMAQGIMVTRWNLGILGQGAVQNLFNVDAWDGYQSSQRRFGRIVQFSRASNPVVLTGDIHSHWGSNLLVDYDDPTSDVYAAEFVCSGISSSFGGPQPQETDALVKASLAQNPHIRYFEGRFRGYCLCDVTPDQWTTRFQTVGQSPSNPESLLAFPDSPVATDATLRLTAGFNLPGAGGRLETL